MVRTKGILRNRCVTVAEIGSGRYHEVGSNVACQRSATVSAILARCATGLGVMLLLSIAAPAWADDGDDPGYVNESSRRVPTKIVPPRPQPRVARQTVRETRPSAARDARAGEGEEAQDDFDRAQAQEWDRGAIREYGIGGTRTLRYRGETPLTFLPPIGLCGLTDP